MGIIRDTCRFASEEIDALLRLDKKVHGTIVYGISHTRRAARRMIRRTSEFLDKLAESE